MNSSQGRAGCGKKGNLHWWCPGCIQAVDNEPPSMSFKPLFTSKLLSWVKRTNCSGKRWKIGLEKVHIQRPLMSWNSQLPARPTQEWDGWIIPNGMLYSGQSKANGLLFKWKSLLQNEFWNTQSFAMYRASSSDSLNKTSDLVASVSVLYINISGVATILSDSAWLPPKTLCSGCKVQDTLVRILIENPNYSQI